MPPTRYTDHLCEHETGIRYLFIVSLLSTLILLGSLSVIDGGTDTYYIAIVQLVTFVPLIGFSFVLMVVCHRRSQERQL